MFFSPCEPKRNGNIFISENEFFFIACMLFLFTLDSEQTKISASNFIQLKSDKHKLCYIKMLLEKTSYMLVCTIYILVGMAITTTIIELVRYPELYIKCM